MLSVSVSICLTICLAICLTGCDTTSKPTETPAPASKTAPVASKGQDSEPDPMSQTNPKLKEEETSTPTSDSNSMTIYHVVSNDQGRHLEPVTMTLSSDLKADDYEARMNAAVTTMAQGKNAPLPNGTRLISLKIDDDTATIDLSKEYKENFTGGDEAESLAVQAITGTLGSISGVKKVQFLIAGEKTDSLGGNIAFDTPVSVPQELLKENQEDAGVKGKKHAYR